MHHDHGVGGFAIIDIAESAADGQNARRQGVLAQEPAGQVHLVRALVADVAVAGVPDPVPVVVQVLPAQRFHRRRTTPQVIVDAGRDRLFAAHLADAGAVLVTGAQGVEDLAEMTLPGPGHRLVEGDGGTTLGAALDDPAVSPGGPDELSTFPDVVRKRLLDVDIAARLHRPEAGQHVPVVGRGNTDSIDVLAVQQLANVLIAFDLQTLLLKPAYAGAQVVFVRVAQGGNADVSEGEQFLKVIAAPSADADNGDADVVVGAAERPVGPDRRQRNRRHGARGSQYRGLQEFAPARESLQGRGCGVVLGHGVIPLLVKYCTDDINCRGKSDINECIRLLAWFNVVYYGQMVSSGF